MNFWSLLGTEGNGVTSAQSVPNSDQGMQYLSEVSGGIARGSSRDDSTGSVNESVRYQCRECDNYVTGVPGKCCGCLALYCPKCSQHQLITLKSSSSASLLTNARSLQPSVSLCAPCHYDYRQSNIVPNAQDYLYKSEMSLYISSISMTLLLCRSLPPFEMDSISHLIVRCGGDIETIEVLPRNELNREIKFTLDIRDCEAKSFPVKISAVKSTNKSEILIGKAFIFNCFACVHQSRMESKTNGWMHGSCPVLYQHEHPFAPAVNEASATTSSIDQSVIGNGVTLHWRLRHIAPINEAVIAYIPPLQEGVLKYQSPSFRRSSSAGKVGSPLPTNLNANSISRHRYVPLSQLISFPTSATSTPSSSAAAISKSNSYSKLHSPNAKQKSGNTFSTYNKSLTDKHSPSSMPSSLSSNTSHITWKSDLFELAMSEILNECICEYLKDIWLAVGSDVGSHSSCEFICIGDLYVTTHRLIFVSCDNTQYFQLSFQQIGALQSHMHWKESGNVALEVSTIVDSLSIVFVFRNRLNQLSSASAAAAIATAQASTTTTATTTTAGLTSFNAFKCQQQILTKPPRNPMKFLNNIKEEILFRKGADEFDLFPNSFEMSCNCKVTNPHAKNAFVEIQLSKESVNNSNNSFSDGQSADTSEFDLAKEFMRQLPKLSESSTTGNALSSKKRSNNNCYWRLSQLNSTFETCSTYPPLLCVPAHVTDEQLTRAATHRVLGRMPTVSWIHSNGAVLCRSAQPLTGIRDKFGVEDDMLLIAMQDAAKQAQRQRSQHDEEDSDNHHGHKDETGAVGSGTSLIEDEDVYCFQDIAVDDSSERVGCMNNDDDLWTSVIVDLTQSKLSPQRIAHKASSPPLPTAVPTPKPKPLTIEESIALAAGTELVDPTAIVSTVTTDATDHAEQQQLQQQIVSKPIAATASIMTTTQLRIIDCRALLSAQGNVLLGKGFENVNRQSLGCVSITFEGIANIHTVRESYRNLKCVCLKMMSLSRTEQNEYLSYYYDLLQRSEIEAANRRQRMNNSENFRDNNRFGSCATISNGNHYYMLNNNGDCRNMNSNNSSNSNAPPTTIAAVSAATITVPTAAALTMVMNKQIQSPATSGGSFLNNISDTKWLQHLSDIIRAAVHASTHLHHKQSPVLVHCSDGWDRTAQVCACAQLLVDPHFRTVLGFRDLVEKEFIAFGHQFRTRSGVVIGMKFVNHVRNSNQSISSNNGSASNSSSSSNSSNGTISNSSGTGSGSGDGSHDMGKQSHCSPIFLQFLDCVWQIWRQFPEHFEFGESFLLYLAKCYLSGIFTEFTCNSFNQRQRRSWQAKECRRHVGSNSNLNAIGQIRTIWQLAVKHKSLIANELYYKKKIAAESARAVGAAAGSGALSSFVPQVQVLRSWSEEGGVEGKTAADASKSGVAAVIVPFRHVNIDSSKDAASLSVITTPTNQSVENLQSLQPPQQQQQQSLPNVAQTNENQSNDNHKEKVIARERESLLLPNFSVQNLSLWKAVYCEPLLQAATQPSLICPLESLSNGNANSDLFVPTAAVQSSTIVEEQLRALVKQQQDEILQLKARLQYVEGTKQINLTPPMPLTTSALSRNSLPASNALRKSTSAQANLSCCPSTATLTTTSISSRPSSYGSIVSMSSTSNNNISSESNSRVPVAVGTLPHSTASNELFDELYNGERLDVECVIRMESPFLMNEDYFCTE